MPSAEAALVSLLNGMGTPIAGGFHLNVLPQNPTLPAVRIQRISTTRSPYRTLDGKASYAAVRMQVDCYATTSLAALNAAHAIYALLEGYSGIVAGLQIDAISTEDERGEFEPGAVPGGANLPKHSLDFIFYHPE